MTKENVLNDFRGDGAPYNQSYQKTTLYAAAQPAGWYCQFATSGHKKHIFVHMPRYFYQFCFEM